MERIARQRLAPRNKKGDKRRQKGDEPDTVTHKKGDKTGDKGRQKGDKADTMTNKKGDKTGDKRRKEGDKADTMTNKKGDRGRRARCPAARRTPVESIEKPQQLPVWGSKEITWETNE